MSDFDPYRKWLGIPPHEQPPNHYRLLGLSPFESDGDVIANAADRQMAHLRTFQGGKNSAISQKILNEVSAARICLLDPRKRAEYDAALRATLESLPSPTPTDNYPPSITAPPVVEATPRPPVAPYHYAHRKKNRWQGPLVTVIASGIALLVAGWFIYAAVEEKRSEQKAAEEKAAAKRAAEKSPKTVPAPPKAKPSKPAEKPSPAEATPDEQPPKHIAPDTPKAPAATPAENEKFGKRLCFMKGNWQEGLPMLADSADDELKKLAKKELAATESVADRLAVADGWWAVSEKYQPPANKQIRRHAVEWYQKVVGELEESDYDRAEWRISLETPTPRGEKKPINPDELE